VWLNILNEYVVETNDVIVKALQLLYFSALLLKDVWGNKMVLAIYTVQHCYQLSLSLRCKLASQYILYNFGTIAAFDVQLGGSSFHPVTMKMFGAMEV
jgi:hypothetical protein